MRGVLSKALGSGPHIVQNNHPSFDPGEPDILSCFFVIYLIASEL